MKFGLFYKWPNPAIRNWKTLFEEGVEQIQYSEVIPALRDVHPPAGLAEELAEAPPVTTEQLQAARLGLAPSDVTAT